MNEVSDGIRVLHITNWYPNHWNRLEHQFIREIYKAASLSAPQELWHVQVRHEGAIFKLHRGSYSKREHYLILDTRIRIWRIVELLTLLLLLALRLMMGFRNWDLVNVHIAYPILRFPRIFRLLFGKVTILSEHWSAYRVNFNLSDGSRAKRRIQQIFRHGIPVIAVSEALKHDISTFAGQTDFLQYVIPNVVDPRLFHPPPSTVHKDIITFLMASSWAPIKRPFMILEAFEALLPKYPQLRLNIVGAGAQWQSIVDFVTGHSLNERIELIGPLEKEGMARHMRSATAFLHASEYETFSVVCAEALCCGLPVIASKVGGIVELVNDTNGILVENRHDDWVDAMTRFITSDVQWSAERISSDVSGRLNPAAVGAQIAQVYQSCISAG